jgi:DNA-binding protein YbaB
MDFMKMAKEAMAMRSKLGELDKSMKALIMDIEYKGIKIKVNGKSEILSIELPQEALADKAKLEKDILIAVNDAVKKAQVEMAKQAQSLTKG